MTTNKTKTEINSTKSTPHYLISITIFKATNLSTTTNNPLNPFCSLSLSDKTKYTEYKRQTRSPKWAKRFDFTFPEKEEKFRLKCLDYKGPNSYNVIGSCDIDLYNAYRSLSVKNWYDIYKDDGTGNTNKTGKIFLSMVAKEIPKNTRHHYSWNSFLKIDINKITDIPLYAKCLEVDEYLRVTVNLKGQKFSIDFGDNFDSIHKSGFLFIDNSSMENHDIILNVYHVNNSDLSLLGRGTVRIFDIIKNDKMIKDVILTNNIDQKLRMIGKLSITTNNIPRLEIEESLFNQLFDYFDTNFDGHLDKDEVLHLLATLSPSCDVSQLKSWIDSLNLNDQKYIHKDDIVDFLGSSEIQSSKFINLLIIATLNGRRIPLFSHLLRGLTYISSLEAESVYVKDRKTGDVIKENIPAYNSLISRLLCDNKHKNMEKTIDELSINMSYMQGGHFDEKRSRSEILPFIKLHSIKLSKFKKSLPEYRSFNDFYTREHQINDQYLSALEDESIFISPSDCRMMIYEHIDDSRKYWIKGKEFTLHKLLQDETTAYEYINGSIVICRLAPEDSHRWYMPITCIHGRINKIDGTLRSNIPSSINNINTNIFTENKRIIVELLSKTIGAFHMILIGGTMLGNMKVYGNPLEHWVKGKTHGKFVFGGSTIVLLFKKGRVKFDRDILKNSLIPIETKIEAKTRIGEALRSKKM